MFKFSYQVSKMSINAFGVEHVWCRGQCLLFLSSHYLVQPARALGCDP